MPSVSASKPSSTELSPSLSTPSHSSVSRQSTVPSPSASKPSSTAPSPSLSSWSHSSVSKQSAVPSPSASKPSSTDPSPSLSSPSHSSVSKQSAVPSPSASKPSSTLVSPSLSTPSHSSVSKQSAVPSPSASKPSSMLPSKSLSSPSHSSMHRGKPPPSRHSSAQSGMPLALASWPSSMVPSPSSSTPSQSASGMPSPNRRISPAPGAVAPGSVGLSKSPATPGCCRSAEADGSRGASPGSVAHAVRAKNAHRTSVQLCFRQRSRFILNSGMSSQLGGRKGGTVGAEAEGGQRRPASAHLGHDSERLAKTPEVPPAAKAALCLAQGSVARLLMSADRPQEPFCK